MGIIEAMLAFIGLLTLIGAAIRWHLREVSKQSADTSRASHYRAGLDAAMRIQVAAQDLEQQLHTEAVRRAEADEASGDTTSKRP